MRNILIINFVDVTSVPFTRFNEQISRERIPTSCSTSFNVVHESKGNIFETELIEIIRVFFWRILTSHERVLFTEERVHVHGIKILEFLKQNYRNN